MNTKHLICVGFAKCGTTLLNFLLSKTNDFVTPYDKKEIVYFRPRNFTNNINDYLSYYHKQDSQELTNKVFFEASPPYVHSSWSLFKKTISNIKTLLIKPKILVCLRHPLYRSFSHYIHNINTHFSYQGFSFKDPPGTFNSLYKNSFFDAINQEKIMAIKYSDKIEFLKSVFGLENICFFIMEKDIYNFDSFYRKLCKFVGIEYKDYFLNQDLPRIHSQKPLAQYLYADEQHLIIQSKNSFYRLEKGDLLICNDNNNYLITNIDEKLAHQVSNSQHFWTKQITAEIAKKITDTYFSEDIEYLSKSLKSYCDTSVYNDYRFKDVSMNISQPNHVFLHDKLTKVF